MANDTRLWCNLKKRYLSRLVKDILSGLVDRDIIDLLLLINSCKFFVTTSSCSGRIIIVSAPLPGDKRRGGIVTCWHERVNAGELERTLNKILEASRNNIVWISVQPLIITMYAYDEYAALRFTKIALEHGYKYSGYRRVSEGFYYVTIVGTERLDIPLMFKGVHVVNDYKVLVDILNTYLTLTKVKLHSFKRRVTALITSLNCYDDATLRGLIRDDLYADLSEHIRSLIDYPTLC